MRFVAIDIGRKVLDAIVQSNRQPKSSDDKLYVGLRELLNKLEESDPEIATRNDYPFGLKHIEDALSIGYKWSEIPTLPAGLQDYNNPTTPKV